MARRVFRILLILVLVALAGVAGWQGWSLDRTRTQQRDDAQRLQREALKVTQAILDIRAAQRAYLSPGQGIAFWKPRVDAHLAALREQFYALREQASTSVSPFAAAAAQADEEAIDALAALKSLEQRIADHVEAGRVEHAADLVYADAVRISLTLERTANAAFTAHDQDLQAGRTRVQWTEGALLALTAAIGFVLAWLLMPARRTDAKAAAATAGELTGADARARAPEQTGRSEPAPALQGLGLGLSSAGRSPTAGAGAAVAGNSGAAAAAGRGASPASGGRTAPASAGTGAPAGGRIAPAAAGNMIDDLPLHAPMPTYASAGSGAMSSGTGTAESTPAGGSSAARSAGSGARQAAPSMAGTAVAVAPRSASAIASTGAGAAAPAPSSQVSSMAVQTQEGLLAAAAELTVSVARVGDVDGLRPVLARLAEHLDAVGVIVWLEDTSSQRLTPIVTHGYPAETLAHLPPIDLDADNATARAWRLAELQIVAGRGAQPGAIVVPMPSSAGCVGVVSAEVRHGREHDPATLALARILAAQLAMLTGARG